MRLLPDQSVLAWFQRAWREAPTGRESEDRYAPHASGAWLKQELGAWVYGLSSVFEARDEYGLDAPASIPELRRILNEHLIVEWFPASERIHLDQGSLRVATDDDEVELAYFFVDSDEVEQQSDRWAFAIHSGELPSNAARESKFVLPSSVPRLIPSGDGEGFVCGVYAPMLSTGWLIQDAVRPFAVAWEGVRLPGFTEHLRGVVPEHSSSGDEGNPLGIRGWPWPGHWLALRAVVEPEDDTIGLALNRINSAAGMSYLTYGLLLSQVSLTGSHEEVHEALATWEERQSNQPVLGPEDIRESAEHLVVVKRRDEEPLILFDDLWASEHPDLALSLLRWSSHWDPLR